jgi:hypothetical protein
MALAAGGEVVGDVEGGVVGEGGGANNGVKLAISAETNKLINTLFNWRLLAQCGAVL